MSTLICEYLAISSNNSAANQDELIRSAPRVSAIQRDTAAAQARQQSFPSAVQLLPLLLLFAAP